VINFVLVFIIDDYPLLYYCTNWYCIDD